MHLDLSLEFLEALLEEVFALAPLEDVHLPHQVLSLLGYQLLRESGLVPLQLAQSVTGRGGWREGGREGGGREFRVLLRDTRYIHRESPAKRNCAFY